MHLSRIRLAGIEDLEPGNMAGFDVEGLSIALFRLETGEFCATSNICTHGNACLSEGWFEDGIVECPLHAGQFDVCTGKGLGAPIIEDLKTYPIHVIDGEVFVDINDL